MLAPYSYECVLKYTLLVGLLDKRVLMTLVLLTKPLKSDAWATGRRAIPLQDSDVVIANCPLVKEAGYDGRRSRAEVGSSGGSRHSPERQTAMHSILWDVSLQGMYLDNAL